MRPFVLAHISDLHVSAFGDTLHNRSGLTKRSANIADVSARRMDVAWEEAGWRVLVQRSVRRGKVVIVDPQGYSHDPPTERETGVADPIERAAAKACRLEARRGATLASSLPSDGALDVLFAGTPRNANIRFLKGAKRVIEENVDAVFITGDLTDDGDGYDLIEAAFSRFVDRHALFAIPGNHDKYLLPVATSTRPRPTHESKREAWDAFADRIGLVRHASGAWTRSIPESSLVLVGLDSCARKQRTLFRQNGAIGEAQMDFLRELSKSGEWRGARHRVVAFHHHVVPLAPGVGLRAPSEIGMRLDDGREFAALLNEIGATLVMHGHRHVSETRHPAGCSFELVAAPSMTLGCKSGAPPSFWRIEFDDRGVRTSRVLIPLEAVESESTLDVTADIPVDLDDGDF